MKKLFITAVLLSGFAFSAQSQNISKNALGLRFGDNNGFGGEVSYQRKLAGDHRLELDLGWRNSDVYDAVKITGVYQWVWNIDGDFNWYAGVGAGLGSWDFNKKYKNQYFNNDNSGGVYAFAAGNIGIEYDFDIPLLISLDFRPEFVLGDGYGDNYGSDIALGLRYQF
ncbi:hypothetical protein [Flavobacterium sp.]|uniref:hypothetical protein n=1 Tax=Flavobacterium sp. TaxID=239 RepID=UPI00286A45E6|nr:hypothetical protein [Flavobacterium sp.]